MANGRLECIALTAARPEHAQAVYCSCERGSGIVIPRVIIVHDIMHDID